MDRNVDMGRGSGVYALAVMTAGYQTPQFIVLAAAATLVIVILLVLAWTSYAHRGNLIKSLNEKSRLERDLQAILERIVRREPLGAILRRIVESLAEACPGAVPLLVLRGDGGLEIFSHPALTGDRYAAMARSKIPDNAGMKWWRDLCRQAGQFADSSPILEIHSGDREMVGVLGLLFPAPVPVHPARNLLLDSFCGVAAAAIENARLYERLAHQARHDVLTGLPNRLRFDNRLRDCLGAAEETGQRLAVFYLDLDRFKYINDSYGHRIGDLFLREVSRRLSGALHEGAMLARIGGDEFTVLLEYGADKASAAAQGSRMHEALSTPILLEGHELTAGVSIGISLFPDHGTTSSTLQKNADAAMYRAKAAGTGRTEFFSTSWGTALVTGQTIRKALDDNEFELFYQPHFTPDGLPRGMEALPRLRCGGGGYLEPGEFAAAVQQSGLALPVAVWTLRGACSQLRQWLDEGVPQTRISIKVTAAGMASAGFAQTVASVLAEMKLPPDLLELEITESAVVQNLAEFATQMRNLRATGVRLTIDDFGTGFSSFAELQTLPICALKIDPALITGISGGGRSLTIESIVAMGKNLGVSVVAEGVETEHQLAVVRESGCDFVQGPLFSKPVNAREARRFLSPENYFAGTNPKEADETIYS
ncbi:MAG: EAL domain-containing protein [Terriglobia bacterium]